jgi:hypothetical protein
MKGQAVEHLLLKAQAHGHIRVGRRCPGDIGDVEVVQPGVQLGRVAGNMLALRHGQQRVAISAALVRLQYVDVANEVADRAGEFVVGIVLQDPLRVLG